MGVFNTDFAQGAVLIRLLVGLGDAQGNTGFGSALGNRCFQGFSIPVSNLNNL